MEARTSERASVKLCPASEISAKLPARIPANASTTINTRVAKKDHFRTCPVPCWWPWCCTKSPLPSFYSHRQECLCYRGLKPRHFGEMEIPNFHRWDHHIENLFPGRAHGG